MLTRMAAAGSNSRRPAMTFYLCVALILIGFITTPLTSGFVDAAFDDLHKNMRQRYRGGRYLVDDEFRKKRAAECRKTEEEIRSQRIKDLKLRGAMQTALT